MLQTWRHRRVSAQASAGTAAPADTVGSGLTAGRTLLVTGTTRGRLSQRWAVRPPSSQGHGCPPRKPTSGHVCEAEPRPSMGRGVGGTQGPSVNHPQKSARTRAQVGFPGREFQTASEETVRSRSTRPRARAGGHVGPALIFTHDQLHTRLTHGETEARRGPAGDTWWGDLPRGEGRCVSAPVRLVNTGGGGSAEPACAGP